MKDSKDNISDKSVTHTDHRSKTKSNSLSNNASRTETSENKRPSSGNIRGV